MPSSTPIESGPPPAGGAVARAAPGLPESGVDCPRCGYDLRGLPQPRCPECGLVFDWNEVRAAAALRTSASTFEYRWRAQFISAFLRTVVLCLHPWRLWRLLPVTMPPRPGPLVLLLACIVALRAALVFGIDLLAICLANRFGPWRAVTLYDWNYPSLVLIPLLSLGAALLVWLALLLLWQTRRRAHARAAHVFRVVALAWTGYMAMWALVRVPTLVLVVLPKVLWSMTWIHPRSHYDELMAWAEWLPFLLFYLSVALGLARGLRIRSGWVDVLLAMGLVFCAGFIACLVIELDIVSWQPALHYLGRALPEIKAATPAFYRCLPWFW